jgi:hypothetical protein
MPPENAMIPTTGRFTIQVKSVAMVTTARFAMVMTLKV